MKNNLRQLMLQRAKKVSKMKNPIPYKGNTDIPTFLRSLYEKPFLKYEK